MQAASRRSHRKWMKHVSVPAAAWSLLQAGFAARLHEDHWSMDTPGTEISWLLLALSTRKPVRLPTSLGRLVSLLSARLSLCRVVMVPTTAQLRPLRRRGESRKT